MGIVSAMPSSSFVDASLEPWERTWAMWTHLGALIAAALSGGLAQFLVPLVIWLSQRDRSDFVADHAREALNFQISVLIWGVLGALLVAACGLGVLVLLAIPIVMLIAGIMASVAGSRGQYYRYPMCFRLIS